VLTASEIRELVDFMFGSMDHFRLATNSDFGAPLIPPKQDFRSETVDFQRGEVEADGHNLYFDKWNWDMEIKPITAAEALALSSRLVPPAREGTSPAPEELRTTSTQTSAERHRSDAESTSPLKVEEHQTTDTK
jgi:hypothetical protein